MKGADFEKALAFVLGEEGGYTNDPSDHGGATNKGITQSEYTEWLRKHHLPSRKVADILNVDVRELYWEEYWLEGRCDRMPWPLCLAHFDASVNVGVGEAVKFLQRALDVKDDGAIGPVTLKALREALEKHAPMELAEWLVDQREPFYRRLAANEPSQVRFLNGWLNRVEHLRAASGIVLGAHKE
jgi:lysozyme family protein